MAVMKVYPLFEVPEKGEIGEFIVTGDHVCRDYYNNDEAFQRAKIVPTIKERSGIGPAIRRFKMIRVIYGLLRPSIASLIEMENIIFPSERK